jgi:hypothetical protein
LPSERQRNEKTDAIGTTAESDRLKRNARSDKMEYALRQVGFNLETAVGSGQKAQSFEP